MAALELGLMFFHNSILVEGVVAHLLLAQMQCLVETVVMAVMVVLQLLRAHQ
jgi:hypothetical protein